jgi:site-specific recombinase XerD
MMTLEDGLQSYNIYARAAGRSKRTIGWICNSTRYFARFLGGNPDCSAVTANDLRRFIIAYGNRQKYIDHPFNPTRKETISPVSVQTYVRGVKAFFSYLKSDELIDANPMLKVKVPRVPVKDVPIHDGEELTRLLRAPDRRTPTGFRNYALMLTLVDTHARISEICNLDMSHVDLEGGYLRLMGKGGKERLSPIGSLVCRAMLKYKTKYRPQPLGTDAFWLGADGRRLTPNRAGFLIRKYGRQVGLDRAYPHKLRHTSSVLYLRNGGDVFSLQKKLGHATLQMTRHYANLADTDVKSQHMKFGVADNLKL